MSFRITVTGSHLDGFTAAELSWASIDVELQIGRVFEGSEGWTFELFSDDASRNVPLDELVGNLQKAKEVLLPYINRMGLNPPAGLSPAGMSLWLMTKSDRTAMGSKVGW